MFGQIAMGVVLAATLMGVFLYALVARGKTELLTAARISTHVSIWAMFIAAGTLLYFIFNYRFDINYVYEHSSRLLSKPLLFASFYASQEGSFMLWALFTAIVAIFLIPYAQRQRYEAPVMVVYLAIFAFLAVMLVAKSPFESIYSAHPGEAPLGFIPKDGKGLNPSLENLWIVIHPPMLFLGFTLLAVPFAFALTALWKRDYQGWVTTSAPWTLGAAMVLGFAIMLGGFWAYETLGWGGYWGWDPVENASLLPWLITLAATHTMLTQKKTGGLIKTNIGMTLLAYALVLYASFLTRSGVLGEASVHSFADPGNLAYSLLLIGLVFFIGASLITFVLRWRDMNARGGDYKILSRETGLSIGSAILGASALVVFVGTSAPLVSKKVDISFYGNLHVPIAIALMLVNGLSMLLKWKQTSVSDMVKKGTLSAIVALVFSVVLYFSGLTDFSYLAIAFSATFALVTNLEIMFTLMKSRVNFGYESGRGELKQRLWSAFRWCFSIGFIGLLLGSAGDYYKFGYLILDYGGYWLALLVVVAGAFSLLGYPRIKFDKRFVGTYLAHAGMAVFILGVIASARYEKKQFGTLMQGVPMRAFGGDYTVTYTHRELEEPENYHFIIDVKDKNGETDRVRPLVFWTAFNNFSEPIRNPGILKFASKDLYFTIVGFDKKGGVPQDSLTKGQEVAIFDGAMKVRFNEFDFPPEERAKMMSQQPFRVKANVEVQLANNPDAKPIPLELAVTRNLKTGEAKEEDIKIPGTSFHLQLSELRPNLDDRSKSKIIFRMIDEQNPPPPVVEGIIVEAFVKPYINLVWGGILIVVIGFAYAVTRRRREALTSIGKAELAYQKILELRAVNDYIKAPLGREASGIILKPKQKEVGPK
ncbi:MAG: cytochrome c biogenesis protein CcsA [bacterium]